VAFKARQKARARERTAPIYCVVGRGAINSRGFTVAEEHRARDIIRASDEFDGRNRVRALTAIRVIRGQYRRSRAPAG